VKIMKKLLTVIVPLALVAMFASVSLAADQQTPELNDELNGDLAGIVEGVAVAPDDSAKAGEEDSAFDDPSLNDTGSREDRSLGMKRGRQPRRGQTATDVADAQWHWKKKKKNHHGGGGGGSDEDADEDEDGDVTPTGN
jgi:hypothetical protein